MLKLKLQYFADGAGQAAGGTAEAAGGANGGITGVKEEAAVPENKRARKSNPLADVKYGKQPKSAAEATEQSAPASITGKAEAETEESFDELIKGKYKKDFDDRVQSIVQSRLKNAKAGEEAISKLMPALTMFAERYNLQPSENGEINVDSLVKAITDDNSLYEAEAANEGMPVEAYKRMKNLERQELIRQQSEARAEQAAQNKARIDKLIKDGEALKQSYPGFELDKEMENETFRRLLASNVPMKTAFEVIHKDEIIKGAVHLTTEEARKQIVNAVASGAKRPAENGIASQGGAIIKDDPKKLTKADREEIRRRVRSGEKIVF